MGKKGQAPWNKGLTKETDRRVAHATILRKNTMQKNIENGKTYEAWNKGIPWTEEVKEKMRTAHLGKHLSEEGKKKVSEFNKGKLFSEETRKKISISKLGKKRQPFSEKTKNNMKLGQQKRNNKNRLLGKNRNHSEETKEKIRQARLQQVIPTKDTSIEIKLQIALEQEGFGFIKHKAIFGQPDIVIEPNICIFADGDYWHNYPVGKLRDKQVTKFLENKGYIVLRFWERDINKKLDSCITRIKAVYDGLFHYYA